MKAHPLLKDCMFASCYSCEKKCVGISSTIQHSLAFIRWHFAIVCLSCRGKLLKSSFLKNKFVVPFSTAASGFRVSIYFKCSSNLSMLIYIYIVESATVTRPNSPPLKGINIVFQNLRCFIL